MKSDPEKCHYNLLSHSDFVTRRPAHTSERIPSKTRLMLIGAKKMFRTEVVERKTGNEAKN